MIAQLLLQIGNASNIAEAEAALREAKLLRTEGRASLPELLEVRNAFSRRKNLLRWASIPHPPRRKRSRK